MRLTRSTYSLLILLFLTPNLTVPWPFHARHRRGVARASPAAPETEDLRTDWQHEAVEKALQQQNSTIALQLLVDAAKSAQLAAGTAAPAIMITIANDEGVDSLLPLFVETLNEVSPVLAHSSIVIAVSRPAFDSCRRHRILCFYDREADERNRELAKAGPHSDTPRNKTPQFLQIGWDKLKRLQDALLANATVLFADTDIVWLRDPLPPLRQRMPLPDIQLTHDGWGPNIGVMYVRPTACTLRFMDLWLARRTKPDARDQYEFPAAVEAAKQSCEGFAVEHLEKSEFPNGCCCGSAYPAAREDAAKWVLWHAACGGDLASKKAHLSRILGASRSAKGQ